MEVAVLRSGSEASLKYHCARKRCRIHSRSAMRPDMISQIIRKQFFCVTDVCVVKINSQTIHVCNWHVHRKYLVDTPGLHKIIPARKTCVTDVLCNWESIPI